MTAPRTYMFEEGWGVDVSPIWSGEDAKSERIVEIDVSVIPIRETDVQIIGEVPCVKVPGTSHIFIPIGNFAHVENLTENDTHDLRSRYFETQAEGRGVRAIHAGPMGAPAAVGVVRQAVDNVRALCPHKRDSVGIDSFSSEGHNPKGEHPCAVVCTWTIVVVTSKEELDHLRRERAA